MSVKSIREYVKNYKALLKANNRLSESQEVEEDSQSLEDNIPMVYDPKKHYEFDYFESKTKSQLLNMIWELQKEHENLKLNFDKLKRSFYNYE